MATLIQSWHFTHCVQCPEFNSLARILLHCTKAFIIFTLWTALTSVLNLALYKGFHEYFLFISQVHPATHNASTTTFFLKEKRRRKAFHIVYSLLNSLLYTGYSCRTTSNASYAAVLPIIHISFLYRLFLSDGVMTDMSPIDIGTTTPHG